MVSTSGCKLLRDDAIDALTSVLFPIADIITPNLHEAQILCGFDIRSESDMVRAADVIYNKYNVTVLLKGGHLANTSNDLLYDGNETWSDWLSELITPILTAQAATLSPAEIAANLAKGMDIKTAVKSAKGRSIHRCTLRYAHDFRQRQRSFIQSYVINFIRIKSNIKSGSSEPLFYILS